jgi:hypothetical protein
MVYYEIGYFLKLIDIFGQGIQLRIGKDTKSKTNLGGILTILMMGLLLAMLIYNIGNVLNRRNPQISVEQQVTEEYPSLVLNQETFPFSISLTNNGNVGVNKPNYFKFSVILMSGLTTSSSLNETEFNLVNCKKKFFPRIKNDSYNSLNMDQNMCIENQNITVTGSWGKEYIAYLVLRVSICSDSTKCAPKDEILSYLRSSTFFWNIYFQNTNINPQNFEEPVKYNLMNYYKMIKINSYKIIEFYMRYQSLNSDEGLFYESNNISNSIAYDYDSFDEGTFDSSNTLAEFNILVSKYNYTYHRNYIKIQNILASIGGLATLLRMTFLIICYIFSIVKRDEVILNKIFEFDLRDEANDYTKRSRRSFIRGLTKIKNDRQKELEDIEYETNKDLIKKFKLNGSEIVKQRPTMSTGGGSNHFLNRNSSLEKEQLNTGSLLNSENKKKDSKISKSLMNEEKIKYEEDVEEDFKNLDTKHMPSTIKKSINRPSFSRAIQKTIAERIRKKEASIFEQKKQLGSINSINLEIAQITTEKNQLASNFPLTSLALDPLSLNDNKDKRIKRKVSEAREILDILERKFKKHKLKFTFTEAIIAFLCCSIFQKKSLISKKKLYDKSNFVVEEFLDITYIIQKLEEFEKFKIVILKSEQIALFNFISKELISLDGEKTKNHSMTKLKALNKDKEHLADIILKYRKKMQTSESLNNIDKKLISLLDEEFK